MMIIARRTRAGPCFPGTFARLEGRLRDLPFPASFRPFAAYEAEATALYVFEHSLIPGLLQTPDGNRAVTWRTSSYSGNNGGQCIEVGNASHVIAVRDSKDRQGPMLAFDPQDWQRFTERVKADAR
jgi:hypothetical protein